MSKIIKVDTKGVKPLLDMRELGYDNYPAGGDVGRVYVGTGTANIALAKKTEVTAVDTKADTHIGRLDNPHSVTKSQVGLTNVDNTSDANKPISTATQNALNTKVDTTTNQTIAGVKTFSSTISGSINGNAATATKLQTARTINGVAFDGTANIVAPTNLTVGERTATAVPIESSTGTNASIPAVTTALAGVMSSADKVKLDGIAVGAQVNVATNLTATAGTTAGPTINSSTGTNVVIPSASATASGVITTTTQTIAGVKTFSSSPIVPIPTTDTQAVNKAYVDGKYSGFKNYIINGGFNVWQRGTSFNIAGGEVRCTDMFLAYNTATTPTASRDSGALGFYNSLKISGANSTSNKHIIHRIEAVNTISFATNNNTKITFSLWLKADVNSTVRVGIRVPNTSDTWGSYTTPKVSNDIQITTSWDRYSVTFDLDFVYWGGITLDVVTGTAQTSLWTTGWQLEQGSVATPFEQRPYGLELSLCQRYYQRGFQHRGVASAYSIGYVSLRIPLHTSMRVIPTISQVQGTTLNLAIEVIGIGAVTPTSMTFGGAGSPNTLQVDFGYTSPNNQVNPVTLAQDIIQCSAEL